MNENSEKTCISLRLSRPNMCDNCISWAERRMLHPGKKRNSKCRRPWLLKESAKVHDRTLRKACGSWDDMICSGIVQNNEIPPTIRIAASKICHDFVTSPSAKKTNEEEAIIHQGQSHRRRTRRPPPRYTPKERKNKVKKKGGAATNVHDNNKQSSSSSPFKNPGIALGSLVNNLENRFQSSLNFFENVCATNVGTVLDDRTTNNYNLSVGDRIQNFNVIIPTAASTSSIEKEKEKEKDLLHRKNIILQREINEAKKDHSIQTKTSQNQINEFKKEKKILQNQIDKLKKENYFLDGKISYLEGQMEKMQDVEMSSFQMKINKGVYTKLIEFKDQIVRLMKQVTSERYVGRTDLGRRLLGEVLATHPSISFVNAAEIIMIARAQLLTEAKLVDEKNLTYDEIGLSSPSEKLLRTILDETTTDVLFLMYFRIFHEDKADGMVPSLYLSCDKATNGGFVKILSWYSLTSNQVEQNIFDVDRTYGDSSECAKAM